MPGWAKREAQQLGGDQGRGWDTNPLLPGALGELGKNLPVQGPVIQDHSIYVLILEVRVLKELTQCVNLLR